jgi:hypothetical protein
MLLLISEVVPPQFFLIPQKEPFDWPTANICIGALLRAAANHKIVLKLIEH